MEETAQLTFVFNHLSNKASIYGEVDKDGIVTFAVRVAEDSPIRGWQMFRRMMTAFGDEARTIQATWRKYRAPSANIDRVNELTSAGTPLEEAIQEAWTVRQAKMIGFTVASVLGIPEGVPGAFTKIDVLIER
jgi:hypothetical protein